jgi:hypothetical protein
MPAGMRCQLTWTARVNRRKIGSDVDARERNCVFVRGWRSASAVSEQDPLHWESPHQPLDCSVSKIFPVSREAEPRICLPTLAVK